MGAGFSAANGLGGISTRAVGMTTALIGTLFQCRERLGWDFYRWYDPPDAVPLLRFSAANGLGGISTESGATVTGTVPVTATFQCRERLGWDFYSRAGKGTTTSPTFQCRERLGWDFYPFLEETEIGPSSSLRFSAANGLGGISTGGKLMGWTFSHRPRGGFSAANGLGGISTGSALRWLPAGQCVSVPRTAWVGFLP
mgnify:CR=1 FL=1